MESLLVQNKDFILQLLKDYPVLATVISGGTLGIIWAYGKTVCSSIYNYFLWCVSFTISGQLKSFSGNIRDEEVVVRILSVLKDLKAKALIPKNFSMNTDTIGDLGVIFDKYKGKTDILDRSHIIPSERNTWFFIPPFGFINLRINISENTSSASANGWLIFINIRVFFKCKNKFIAEFEKRFNNINSIEKTIENNIVIMKEGRINFMYKRPLSSIYTNANVKEELLEDIKLFIERREFYKKHNIPYKRNYLLYGPPGTGKTSLIKSVASELNIPLMICENISEMKQVPVFVVEHGEGVEIRVLEDVDGLFGELARKNITVNPRVAALENPRVAALEHIKYTSTGLQYVDEVPEDPAEETLEDPAEELMQNLGSKALTDILNILDGLRTRENVIYVLTTNHIEKLPPSLLRDGRMDYKVELDYLEPEPANRMLSDLTGITDVIIKKKICPASLQELCIRYLLNIYNKEELLSKLEAWI